MRLDGYVAGMGEVRNAYNILAGKAEGKRSKRKCKDNIKTYLTDVGFKDIDWIHLAHDKDQWRDPVNTVMKLRIP
jgi:hypothetical protein